MEYYEKIIDEIVEIIKTNIILQYRYNDNFLIKLKSEYELLEKTNISEEELLEYVRETIKCLENSKTLYDLRDTI